MQLSRIRTLLFSKSDIERKRELYEKKLREERIIVYNDQIRKLLNRKEQENLQKQIEFTQRIQNVNVTNSFLSRRNKQRCETIKQNRNTWSQQCVHTYILFGFIAKIFKFLIPNCTFYFNPFYFSILPFCSYSR